MSAANELAVHLKKQVCANPQLAYLIGPGCQTWDLLCQAMAAITGETPKAIEAQLCIKLITQPVRPELVEGHDANLDDLRQGVSRTAHEVLDRKDRGDSLWAGMQVSTVLSIASSYARDANARSSLKAHRADAVEAAAMLIHAAERLAQ